MQLVLSPILQPLLASIMGQVFYKFQCYCDPLLERLTLMLKLYFLTMVLVLYRFEGKWNCLIKQSFILSADTGIGLVAEGSGGTIANSLFVGSTQTRFQDQTDDQQLNSIARLEGGVGGNLMQDNLFQCQVTWQKCENLRPGNLMINAWRCTRGVGSEVHSWWMASHQCQVHQLWHLWPYPCWRQP